jgi:hypothetical protein
VLSSAAKGDPDGAGACLPRADKVTIRDLADDLVAEYAANARRSADRLAGSLGHLLPALGDRRAVQLTSAEVTAYTLHRQQEGAANATVNRELAALKRMFSLAVNGEKVPRAPHISMLLEDNTRKGFFEREQFEAVRRQLPIYAQPPVTFAYVTGWRLQGRDPDAPVAAGGLRGRHRPARARDHEEPGRADVRHGPRAAGLPGGPAGGYGGAAARGGPDHPVRLPPRRAAAEGLPSGLEDRLPAGRRPWPDPP